MKVKTLFDRNKANAYKYTKGKFINAKTNIMNENIFVCYTE